MAKLTLSPLRLHQVMYSLVYPAILGSFLYAFWDKAANAQFSLADPSPWVAGSLFIVLFALDYAYSLGKSVPENYSGPAFLADMLIVMLIYLTAQTLFGTKVKALDCVSVWVYLFLLKFISSVWELFQIAKVSKSSSDSYPTLVHMDTDYAMAVVCVPLLFLTPHIPTAYQFIPLAVFFLVDGLIYLANTSDS